MSTALPTVTKATARELLARRVGDWAPRAVTTTGNAGGTTARFAALAGYGDDHLNNKWGLQADGANAGKFAQVSDFNGTTGEVTFLTSLGAQIVSGVTFAFHNLPPSDFTQAWNEAVHPAYPAVYRLVDGYVLAVAGVDVYATPRNVHDIVSLRYDEFTSEVADDPFTRDDSASTASTTGHDYTAVAGTWGIASNKLYSVSDADANLLVRAVGQSDLLLEARVSGTLASGSVYRSPALVFRYSDSSNYLLVRLLNGAAQLMKVEGGAATTLSTGTVPTADGTDYDLRVLAVGPWVRVFGDGVELISHLLLGGDAKFAAYTSAGFRLDKAGSPATAARWDNYRVHKIGPLVDLHDWEQDPDRRTFRLGAVGASPSLTTDRLIVVSGRAPLSQFSGDTPFGTLVSDSTAVLEIATTDPAWSLALDYAEAALHEIAAQPLSGLEESDRADHAVAAQTALAKAERNRGRQAMASPRRTVKYPN